MKEQILKLREDGKSYREIKKTLGCSSSTISYHCGEGQKEKTTKRSKKFRGDLRGIVLKKIYAFRYNKRQGKSNGTINIESDSFFEDALNKITSNPVCYLTGRKINLLDSRSYHLDHIIPWAKGGTSELDNLGLACREANQAKWDLSLDEYVSLCKEIINNLDK